MKITAIIPHALSVAYEEPVWTAHECFRRSQLVLVELRTDAGIVGFGGIATGSLKLVCSLVATFSDVVDAMAALGQDEVGRNLMSLTPPRPGGIGGWDGLPAPL